MCDGQTTHQEPPDGEGSTASLPSSIQSTSASSTTQQKPALYLIICNISKPANIRALLLAGVAFGCRKFFVAGQKRFDFFGPDMPRQLHNLREELDIVVFDRLDECVHHVKHVVKAKICGVEIVESAIEVDEEPFFGDTAIMMGNEGTGMNKKQLDVCDYFVRIKQYGGGTASLNVYVAASIVMHRFHHWATRRIELPQS